MNYYRNIKVLTLNRSKGFQLPNYLQILEFDLIIIWDLMTVIPLTLIFTIGYSLLDIGYFLHFQQNLVYFLIMSFLETLQVKKKTYKVFHSESNQIILW